MNSLVSIVMAVYNGQKYLESQIESILAQSYKNIELIIVDDKSIDKSIEIISNFAKKDDRVKIFKNNNNLGIVENFLKGLEHAAGDFFCFCDQDDYWVSDKIEVLSRLLDKDKKNMLAYSDMEICDENLKVLHKSFQETSGILPRKGHLGEISFLRNIMPGCSMMFRKEVKELLNKMKEPIPLMHDHMAFIVSSLLGNIVYSKKQLVKYRQHNENNIGAFYDSIVNSEKIISKLDQAIYYFEHNLKDQHNFDLDKLKEFCKVLKSRNILKRSLFMDYFLFLRRDTFLDKILGRFYCLFPDTYERLKRFHANGTDKLILLPLKRVLFLIWTIAVFYFFISEFVICKILKVLGR